MYVYNLLLSYFMYKRDKVDEKKKWNHHNNNILRERQINKLSGND